VVPNRHAPIVLDGIVGQAMKDGNVGFVSAVAPPARVIGGVIVGLTAKAIAMVHTARL
jgi:N6-L-threonylcarbamoyladenine synthase